MNRNKFSSSPGQGDHVKPAADIFSARDDSISTVTKARYDVTSLYDQVELAQPSTRVKRKLKIINPAASNNITTILIKQSLSPNKHLPSILEAKEEKVFGRPTKPCDNINDVMQYSHLNDYLR